MFIAYHDNRLLPVHTVANRKWLEGALGLNGSNASANSEVEGPVMKMKVRTAGKNH